MALKMRIGLGHDIHALVPGRRLVLGGVEIPFERGLEGWSDADVVVHAIMDALLGAAGLGDIGLHFPPGDPAYHGISSLELLSRVKKRLEGKAFRIVNVDVIIIAEAPRLRGYIPLMVEKIAASLGIEQADINIKAGTAEKLGAVGRGEGIAAEAVALLELEPANSGPSQPG